MATVQVMSSTLPSGTYTVTYSFSDGATDGSGSQTMSFTAGSPGTGTFQTGTITGYLPISTTTISNLSSGTAPGICSSTVNSNNSAALPVTWRSFRATPNERNGVDLLWSTASEANNEGFDVERSANGRDWEPIAFVPGAGNTSEIQTYQYTDPAYAIASAGAALIYYRLKQIDFDGSFDYSPIRIVEIRNQRDIRVYPNPADEEVTISFAEPTTVRGIVRMYSQQNRLVAEHVIPPHTTDYPLRVAQLPAGTYILQVMVGNEQWSKRVVVE